MHFFFLLQQKVDGIESNYHKLAGAKPFQPVNWIPGKVPEIETEHTNPIIKMTEGITEVVRGSLREEDNERDREFWIFASQIADRIFMIVLSIFFVFSISSILKQVPDHYSFP